jgi:Mor family transcriptional regulator
MPRIENKERNDEIYALSKKGGGKMSMRELQKKYGFKSKTTILEILKLVEKRRARTLTVV